MHHPPAPALFAPFLCPALVAVVLCGSVRIRVVSFHAARQRAPCPVHTLNAGVHASLSACATLLGPAALVRVPSRAMLLPMCVLTLSLSFSPKTRLKATPCHGESTLSNFQC